MYNTFFFIFKVLLSLFADICFFFLNILPFFICFSIKNFFNFCLVSCFFSINWLLNFSSWFFNFFFTSGLFFFFPHCWSFGYFYLPYITVGIKDSLFNRLFTYENNYFLPNTDQFDLSCLDDVKTRGSGYKTLPISQNSSLIRNKAHLSYGVDELMYLQMRHKRIYSLFRNRKYAGRHVRSPIVDTFFLAHRRNRKYAFIRRRYMPPRTLSIYRWFRFKTIPNFELLFMPRRVAMSIWRITKVPKEKVRLIKQHTVERFPKYAHKLKVFKRYEVAHFGYRYNFMFRIRKLSRYLRIGVYKKPNHTFFKRSRQWVTYGFYTDPFKPNDPLKFPRRYEHERIRIHTRKAPPFSWSAYRKGSRDIVKDYYFRRSRLFINSFHFTRQIWNRFLFGRPSSVRSHLIRSRPFFIHWKTPPYRFKTLPRNTRSRSVFNYGFKSFPQWPNIWRLKLLDHLVSNYVDHRLRQHTRFVRKRPLGSKRIRKRLLYLHSSSVTNGFNSISFSSSSDYIFNPFFVNMYYSPIDPVFYGPTQFRPAQFRKLISNVLPGRSAHKPIVVCAQDQQSFFDLFPKTKNITYSNQKRDRTFYRWQAFLNRMSKYRPKRLERGKEKYTRIYLGYRKYPPHLIYREFLKKRRSVVLHSLDKFRNFPYYRKIFYTRFFVRKKTRTRFFRHFYRKQHGLWQIPQFEYASPQMKKQYNRRAKFALLRGWPIPLPKNPGDPIPDFFIIKKSYSRRIRLTYPFKPVRNWKIDWRLFKPNQWFRIVVDSVDYSLDLFGGKIINSFNLVVSKTIFNFWSNYYSIYWRVSILLNPRTWFRNFWNGLTWPRGYNSLFRPYNEYDDKGNMRPIRTIILTDYERASYWKRFLNRSFRRLRLNIWRLGPVDKSFFTSLPFEESYFNKAVILQTWGGHRKDLSFGRFRRPAEFYRRYFSNFSTFSRPTVNSRDYLTFFSFRKPGLRPIWRTSKRDKRYIGEAVAPRLQARWWAKLDPFYTIYKELPSSAKRVYSNLADLPDFNLCYAVLNRGISMFIDIFYMARFDIKLITLHIFSDSKPVASKILGFSLFELAVSSFGCFIILIICFISLVVFIYRFRFSLSSFAVFCSFSFKKFEQLVDSSTLNLGMIFFQFYRIIINFSKFLLRLVLSLLSLSKKLPSHIFFINFILGNV